MLLFIVPVRPQSVKILRKESYLTEGAKVQIVCEARGSQPPAQIRWYLGESPQDNFKIKVGLGISQGWSSLLNYPLISG